MYPNKFEIINYPTGGSRRCLTCRSGYTFLGPFFEDFPRPEISLKEFLKDRSYSGPCFCSPECKLAIREPAKILSILSDVLLYDSPDVLIALLTNGKKRAEKKRKKKT